MNSNEATRFAHKLIADTVATFINERGQMDDLRKSPDGKRIDKAVNAIIEQHRRFGPKTTDRAPRPAPPPPSLGLPLGDVSEQAEGIEPEILGPDSFGGEDGMPSPAASTLRMTLAEEPAGGRELCSARRMKAGSTDWYACIKDRGHDGDHLLEKV